MKRVWSCRRTFIALVAIGSLTYLGINGADVVATIGFIVAAVAGSNAYENVYNKDKGLDLNNK